MKNYRIKECLSIKNISPIGFFSQGHETGADRAGTGPGADGTGHAKKAAASSTSQRNTLTDNNLERWCVDQLNIPPRNFPRSRWTARGDGADATGLSAVDAVPAILPHTAAVVSAYAKPSL
jgi:hypothetical protein